MPWTPISLHVPVRVIPFADALDDNLCASDKWSRPLDDTVVPNDYRKLPSVL